MIQHYFIGLGMFEWSKAVCKVSNIQDRKGYDKEIVGRSYVDWKGTEEIVAEDKE